MSVTFSDESQARIDAILPRYPTKMAACLPVLWVAQEQFGWISDEVMRLVADTLDLPHAHVHSVVTFYTMYNKAPVGRYHVQVCTNISCMLRGGYEVLRAFEKELDISSGETTSDNMFTLNEVECLAACGTAPCVQVNDRYYEPVQPDGVVRLLDTLRGKTDDGIGAHPETIPERTVEKVEDGSRAGVVSGEIVAAAHGQKVPDTIDGPDSEAGA